MLAIFSVAFAQPALGCEEVPEAMLAVPCSTLPTTVASSIPAVARSLTKKVPTFAFFLATDFTIAVLLAWLF